MIQASLESKHVLAWIPCSPITDIRATHIDTIHYAIRKETLDDGRVKVTPITLVLLGSIEKCTSTLVSEFARIYSLPTHKYNIVDNNFRRYSVWLKQRNKLIKGFIKYDNDNYYYYMVADRRFYHCYSRYGFCAACGILRCSSVWCICGHTQLSDEWTSNNKKLDDFIKKSQLQTNSPNDAYLEWIPFDCIDKTYILGLPTYGFVNLIPLEITDSTHDLYYAEVNYLLMRHVY